MTIRRFLLFYSFVLYSISAFSQSNQNHEVMPGETLYSLSKRYNTTVDALKQANNLKSDGIKAGQVLIIPSSTNSVPSSNVVPQTHKIPDSTPTQREVSSHPSASVQTINIQIPKCKLTYITDKKTTVSEICAKFGISESALLSNNPDIKKAKIKKGTSLCIPYTESELKAYIQAEAQRIAQEEANKAEAARQAAEAEKARKEAEIRANQIDNIKVALILPFELSQEKKSQEAIKMIDFYEGMLLAIDDLKAKGANVELQVYDEQETPIDSVISKIHQNPCNLIIGAKNLENINRLRAYSKRNNILMAVPFSSKEDLTVGHPTLFQINMKSSLLYDQVYQIFAEENKNANVVFVTCSSTDDNRYINDFQTYLSKHNIPHITTDIEDLSSAKEMAANGKQVVLIPSNKSVESFKKIVSALDGYESEISSRISMFGYPEWQTFSTENTNKLRLYHCSFYTTFYAHLNSEEVLNFTGRFKSKFNRDQYNSRPLYGLLGYDVTNYFIGGLHKYGKVFIPNLDSMQTPALQNPMHFERNFSIQNGFINKNIKIIHP